MIEELEAQAGDAPSDVDAGDAMHIHRPKPLHGARELLTEIAVIVVGIVIALGLEETLRTLHDQQTAREAREAVRTEIRLNLSYMKGRMTTQACVERRLDEIGALLAKAGDGPLSPQPKWIGQPSVWFMASQRWQAATGSGRASLLDAEEQGRLAALYVVTSNFSDAEAREQAAWAQLRGLETWSGPLGPVARVHFAAALQEARYELWDTRVGMELAFRRAKELGIQDYAPNTMSQGYAVPHAVCLPIDTPRDAALKLLGHDSPPWGQPR